MEKRYSRTSVSVFKVFGQVLFIYGLLAWGYGVAIQITHPGLLVGILSHLTPWIRLDTFTIVSFFLSILGFIIWRLAKELGRP